MNISLCFVEGQTDRQTETGRQTDRQRQKDSRRVIKNSDPGQDHQFVGCLEQTSVSLPEKLIYDHAPAHYGERIMISPELTKQNQGVSGDNVSMGGYPRPSQPSGSK